MSETKKASLPWVSLPGTKRPRFNFVKIKFGIPTAIPTNLIYLVIFMSILYIYIGGVYDLVEDPIAFGGRSDGSPLLIYPGTDRQFMVEGIVAGLVMMMGAGGLILISQATNDPHDTSRASNYQMIGFILIVVAFFILQNMYNCKDGTNQC